MGDAQTLIYRLRFTSTDSALAHYSPLTHPSGGSKSFDRREEKDMRREEAGRMAASSHQAKRVVRVHSPEAITAQELPGGW